MIGSVETVEEIPQPFSVPHWIGESSKSSPTTSKPSENAASKSAPKLSSQPKAATKAECPPELRPIFEAEQRRAAETAANLALCSAAISGVNATLLSLTNGSNRQFVESMRVYLRAAIAQYMATGPAPTPPVLPPRQEHTNTRRPSAVYQKHLGYGSKKRTTTKSSSYSKGCAATCGQSPKERNPQGESRQATVPSP
ncbi:EKA-like protein [Blumeria hordei DH14]|uniref:EKA-like protein n=1 Tax=Blumeria graminis f. sp. hordei (strain DH14) TaxID=546991 RepID=N1JBZ9_BLUG1|nr:EKA-like protein [Blumeria hordei DH14]